MDLSEEFWIFVSKHINEHPCAYYKYSTENEEAVANRGKTWFGDWERFKVDYVGSHSIIRVLSTLRAIKDDIAENCALNIEKAINELAINIEDVKVSGGDKENTWYFYCQGANSYVPIAIWAKNVIGGIFADMPLDTIINQHMFFGSDTGCSATFLNGDTIVLYKDINALDEAGKKDAKYARKN